jgi:hypothetical protein
MRTTGTRVIESLLHYQATKAVANLHFFVHSHIHELRKVLFHRPFDPLLVSMMSCKGGNVVNVLLKQIDELECSYRRYKTSSWEKVKVKVVL